MIDLDVVPERSLGNELFELILDTSILRELLGGFDQILQDYSRSDGGRFGDGMPFQQTVATLKQNDGCVKAVQVWYSDQNPLQLDLVLNLSLDGIRLIYDSCCQRLKIIEVYNMSKVKLKYCGMHFNSPDVTPTIQQVEHSFGATHPGVYDSEHQVFMLNFRGLSFTFPIDSRFEPSYTQKLGSLQFPSGSSPVVSRMCIYSGNSLADTRPPPLPLACFHGNIFLESLELLKTNGLASGLNLHISSEARDEGKLSDFYKTTLHRKIQFGCTCQVY